ncbi:amino acid adenylation domain-containing protein [Streptomyces sp. 3213]|uniref:non-ribosomal peptide synthetase n=1 Tax=Streptomyces sp. 3213.3 TaxID=1855348 RepID=UPI00089AC10E|nr:non-ribosomal peptide synthetase [Streptomyces sp. 3213.3]SEC38073.1 amino acid adenylation domain-containing protein [Streptomyces sp. 3213] [Streptomyces sp. 3213.3]
MTEIPTRPGTRPRRFSAENLRRVHHEAGLDPVDAEPTAAKRADRPDPAQEDVWLFDLTTPEALVHQIAMVVDLTGPFDRETAARAVRMLGRRHEALRARFPADVSGTPVMVIEPEFTGEPEYVDLTAAVPAADSGSDGVGTMGAAFDAGTVATSSDSATESAVELRWTALADRETHRPFDLEKGPPARFVLARLAGQRHRLLTVVHHIVADGRTLQLLHGDLVAALRGEALPTPPPTLAAAASRARAAADRPDTAQRLERRAAELADLPADADRWPSFGRPSTGDPYAAEILPVDVPAPLAEAVHAIAAAERATPYMVWLTALSVLVQRMSGHGEAVLGTVVGRRDAASRDTAGFITNQAALRVRLGSDATWRDALRVAREVTLSAFDDADIPFRRVVERLAPARRPDAHPLFQVLLGGRQPLDPPTTVGPLTVEASEHLSRRSLYEVELQLADLPTGMPGYLRYRTAALDSSAAAAVVAGFVRLLEVLTSSPDSPIAATPWPAGLVAPARVGKGAAGPAVDRGIEADRPRTQLRRRADIPRRQPSNPTQRRVAEVWRTVLEQLPPGIDDDFFAIGGHSLSAVRVASLLASEFHLPITARALFDHPTVAEVSAFLDGWAASLAGRPDATAPVAPASDAPVVVTERTDAGAPLSATQQRMWLQSQLYPDNAVYNLPYAFRVSGDIDAPALEAALGDLVARHEALRTVVDVHDEQARQRVLPAVAVRLAVDEPEDAGSGGSAPADLAAWVVDRIDAEARAPFDLSAGPLIRARLIAPGTASAAFVVTAHHIACDGWSLELLFAELAELYTARTENRPSTTTAPAIQFVDFAAWQSEQLTGARRERLADYWRGQLEGAPTLLDLPTDRTRPAQRRPDGAVVDFAWPADLEEGVAEFSRRHGVTAYATLLAAFASVVHRHTGRDDLLIGTPVANRVRPEFAKTVGCFVNLVPLRLRVAADTTFLDLARSAHLTISQAQEHQDFPFEDLVALLRPERDPSHDPVVQLLFVLQDVDTALSLPGVDLAPLPAHGGGAIQDLTVILQHAGAEAGGGFLGTAEFNTSLYGADTLSRLLGHLSTLLQAALSAPDTAVGDLDLLTPDELAQLERWNDTGLPAPSAADVPALFERWADRTPERTAVVGAEGELSYAALEARANRLAHHLAEIGVGPGTAVGVALDRCQDLPVAFLGVLKAGAVYVPLDTAYPAERLALMIGDTEVKALITRAGRAEPPGADGLPVIRLGGPDDPLSRYPDTRPARHTQPGDPAYIVFTSGSTGRPKGVAIHHRGVVNSAHAELDFVDPQSPDTVIQFSSPSFDGSVLDFTLAFAHGGRLCVVPRDRMLPGPDLAETVRRYQVTLAFLPPSALAVMQPDDVPGLRTILVGGEAFPPELGPLWAPNRRLFNIYGPTETTIWCTHTLLDGTERRPTIGGPVPGATAHVVDERLRPVPVGVPGELCIGGLGVGLGYLRRPELTARQFPLDPYAAQPGARLYRTGDLVRRLPDGKLDYLGRIDRQVKIRGHRVELPEIEARLERIPGVGRGVATARRDQSGPGPLRLVAYVSPAAPLGVADLDPSVLRRQLAQTLPEYMVPAVIVPLAAFPLNSNGKIDHAKLPEPPRDRNAGAARVAPVSRLEREIAAVWCELLGLDEVGTHDNFFEIGGDSLLLARVRTRLTQVLDRDIAALQLFTHPTVHDLAAALSNDTPRARAVAPAAADRAARPGARSALLTRSRRATAGRDDEGKVTR